MDNQALLRYAARRASDRPFFVAHTLIRYQQVHGMDEAELARWLEMEPEKLPELALCRRPTTQQEVQEVAAYVGCNAERLAHVLEV